MIDVLKKQYLLSAVCSFTFDVQLAPYFLGAVADVWVYSYHSCPKVGFLRAEPARLSQSARPNSVLPLPCK